MRTAYGPVIAAGCALFVACSEAPPRKPPNVEEKITALDPAGLGSAPAPAAATPDIVTAPAPGARPGTLRRTPPHSVLYIGDSLVGFRGGLSKALEPRFKKLGATFASDAWGGVGIQRFERSARLEEWLEKGHPDFVLVSLGMNDVDAPHPESLAPMIRSIVRRIGRRPCIFVGPPTTKQDTGVVATLERTVAPCLYIDSRGLDIERVDGLHPSDRGGEVWAEGIWSRVESAFASEATATR